MCGICSSCVAARRRRSCAAVCFGSGVCWNVCGEKRKARARGSGVDERNTTGAVCPLTDRQVREVRAFLPQGSPAGRPGEETNIRLARVRRGTCSLHPFASRPDSCARRGSIGALRACGESGGDEGYENLREVWRLRAGWGVVCARRRRTRSWRGLAGCRMLVGGRELGDGRTETPLGERSPPQRRYLRKLTPTCGSLRARRQAESSPA